MSVRVQRDGAVATVTIARANKHNAITPEIDAAVGRRGDAQP